MKEFPYVLVKENKWICVLNLAKGRSYKLIQNEDKCANGRRLEFLPRDAQRKGSEYTDHKTRDVCFISTSCNIVKDSPEGQRPRSWVQNGCVKKFKINGQLFVELSKFED